MAARGGRDFVDRVAEAEEDLREAGAADEVLEFGPEGGDLDGLIEVRRLDAVEAGLEENAGEGLAGAEPVGGAVAGGEDCGEDGRLVGDLPVSRTNTATHVEGANDSLFERRH